MEARTTSIDIGYAVREFHDWVRNGNLTNLEDSINSLSSSEANIEREFLSLVAIRNKLSTARELTYVRCNVPKILNPLIRFFRRKKIDRALCELHEAIIEALFSFLEFQKKSLQNTIKTEARIDELVRCTDALSRNYDSFYQKHLNLSQRFIKFRESTDKAIVTEQSQRVSSLNDATENLLGHFLNSTSALRLEMTTQWEIHEKLFEELKETGIAALNSLREETSSRAMAVETTIDKFCRYGTNALSPEYWKRVMDDSFYSRMRGDMNLLRERFENRYDILEHVLGIDRMGKQLHCLDLGCGSGEWLDVLKDKGHVVFGIDHDKRMTALCRKKGYEALSGDFFDALGSIDDHSFDLVSLFHVVEHLGINDICRLLDEFHRICRTGFHLLIEVPNIHNPFLSTANYFLDPTHRTKLPLELLDHLLNVFHYDLEHARFIERNPVHAQLYRGGQSLSVKRDQRYDHMELLLIGTARAHD